MNMEDCPNGIIKKREVNNREKCAPLSAFSNTNSIQIVMEVNPGLRGEKSSTKFLRYGGRKRKGKRSIKLYHTNDGLLRYF
jgi:hypothetical protein